MMLRHLGLDEHAKRIERATLDTIADGKVLAPVPLISGVQYNAVRPNLRST